MSAERSRRSEPFDPAIMEALDWPEHLKPLQDAYWEKRREWEEVERAFFVAAAFCLEHAENVVSAGKP